MFNNVRTALLLGVLLAPTAVLAQSADAPKPAAQDSATEQGATETPTTTAEPAASGEAPAETNGKPKAVTGQDLPGQLSMGESREETEVGKTYVKEKVKDWTVQCVRTPEGNDPCQLYQLLRDKDGNAVSEISVFALKDGGQAKAGATIITPLETLLTEQLTLAVDSSSAKRYPFSWCSQVGCFARIGLTEQDLAAFRKGSEVKMLIVPVAAPDQKVELSISLSGFTAGFDMAAGK